MPTHYFTVYLNIIEYLLLHSLIHCNYDEQILELTSQVKAHGFFTLPYLLYYNFLMHEINTHANFKVFGSASSREMLDVKMILQLQTFQRSHNL